MAAAAEEFPQSIQVLSIMSAEADREVGGGGGDAHMKGSLALVQKRL